MDAKLEFLLFGLAAILRRNAKKPLVQAKLRDRSRAIQVRTRDGVARAFLFCGGAVFSRRGLVANPDVSLVWTDASTAAQVMTSSAPDALQTALANEWVTIVGDAEVARWFGDLVRLARGGAQEDKATRTAAAVIGLGRMGSGIAVSLLRAGFPVTVYNRTEEKMRPLVDAGAKAATSPAAAARTAKFVVTSLLSDEAVFAMVEGPGGLLAGLGRDAVHIGASTISADATRRLVELHAEHGGAYLAAPVVGRPEAAVAGELVALVSGKQSIFEASRPVIEGYTRQVLYLGGDHAVALATKLAVNYTAATIIDLMGQVYAFGDKAGIPSTALHTMFRALWAQPVMQGYATRIWHRDFNEVGFDLRGGLKDLTLMVDAAKAQGMRWEFAETIQRKMARGVELGFGSLDWSSVYEVTRDEAGLGR